MISRVYEELEKMTRTEQQAADYFLAHPNSFALSTLEKVAGEIGVSTTTVIRFCRRLGFDGFKDFQQALRKDMKHQLALPFKLQQNNLTVSGELLARVIDDGINAISTTFSGMPMDLLDSAIEKIGTAKRIFVFGMRESFAIVHYIYTRLTTVRREVHILDAGYRGMIEPMLDLTKDDLCIAVIFHRYAEQSIKILPRIKEQGSSVILITSDPYDTLAPYADIILPCHVQNNGIKNTSLAPICLADYFCNAIAVQYPDETTKQINSVEKLLRGTSILDILDNPDF